MTAKSRQCCYFVRKTLRANLILASLDYCFALMITFYGNYIYITLRMISHADQQGFGHLHVILHAELKHGGPT